MVKKVTQMYVEPETVEHDDEKEFMKSRVNRIKILSSKLSNAVSVSTVRSQLIVFGDKIDRLAEHIDESIFLTPLRSPKKHWSIGVSLYKCCEWMKMAIYISFLQFMDVVFQQMLKIFMFDSN